MKKARAIPLSGAARDLLAGLTSDRSGYLFTGRSGKVIGGKRKRVNGVDTVEGGEWVAFAGAMHKDAMQNLLREMDVRNAAGELVHVHGFRASFTGWVAKNPALGRWDLLMFSLPFLGVGFLWFHVMMRKRKYRKSQLQKL